MTHVHVGLVVPGLDVEEDGGLGDHLRLLGLLLVVGLQPLLGDPLLLLVILLLVAAEQIHVVIVVLGSGGRSATHVRGGVFLRLGELLHTGGEGLDVVVPPEGVGRVLGGPGQSLKHGGVSLTGDIPAQQTCLC